MMMKKIKMNMKRNKRKNNKKIKINRTNEKKIKRKV